MSSAMAGAIPSPNIWRRPEIYERENRAVDPDGVIEAAMREIRDWADGQVLDIGCGSGFHLPRFARTAAAVTGVEPHPRLVALAQRRVRDLPAVTVRQGVAQRLPVPDASVDVAHARWAYFFGPGCEPGLAELARVMRRGGFGFVIDNDATRSTFGGWFRRLLPDYDSDAVERFFSGHGFVRQPLDICWRFDRWADLAAVVGIEFPPELASEILAEQRPQGLVVDYAINLWWRRY